MFWKYENIKLSLEGIKYDTKKIINVFIDYSNQHFLIVEVEIWKVVLRDVNSPIRNFSMT